MIRTVEGKECRLRKSRSELTLEVKSKANTEPNEASDLPPIRTILEELVTHIQDFQK